MFKVKKEDLRVPDHGAVLDADLVERLVDVANLLDTLVERLLGTEDGRVGLHRLLHLEPDVRRRLGAAGVPDLVEVLDALQTSVRWDLLVRLARSEVVPDVVSASAAEDDDVEERVGAETVRTVHGHTRSLARGVQARHDLVLALRILSDDFASELGRDTAHVVVHSREDGDRLLRDVNAGEDGRGLGDTRETLGEDVGRQVAQLEEDMVLVLADTATLADLDRHGTRDNVTRGQVLRRRRVPLHKPLALAVQEVASLAARALGDEAACAVDAGRVELDELEVLEGKARARNHGVAVARACVRRRAAEVRATVPAGSEDSLVRAETVECAVLHVQRNHADALAVLHDEIESEVLDEEVGVVTERLAVEGVEEGVTCAVRGGSAAVGLATLAELERLSAESALIDFALLGTREGKTEVLELENGARRLTAHVVDGVLVAEPVGALHSVVHVPPPVILGHVLDDDDSSALLRCEH
jgi:hypothetical protein